MYMREINEHEWEIVSLIFQARVTISNFLLRENTKIEGIQVSHLEQNKLVI